MSPAISRPEIRSQVLFADHTTLGVGGPAEHWAECDDDAQLADCLNWARSHEEEIFVLGGGSNLLVADTGFSGLVVLPRQRKLSAETKGSTVVVRVGAGRSWDELVALTVAEGWAGLECLSGIPGHVGAAPIQNIGAYGQEVAQSIRRVRVMERRDSTTRWLSADQLGFGYRHSRFKSQWRDRFVITEVEFQLKVKDQGTILYPALRSHLGLQDQDPPPDLRATRRAVLEIRGRKSMVLDAQDPNRRSAGSFFVNPVLPLEAAERVQERVDQLQITRAMPRYPADNGVKLSAAWLIEEAGFKRGHIHGQAGLSSRHTLALINRGSARAQEILDLSWQIRHRVSEVFGVELKPEPVFLGIQDQAPDPVGP